MNCFEVNFDGLAGPTHHFGGLSYGNIASLDNQMTVSNPQAAALQGLEKMRLLASLGIKQGVIPPLPRPHIPTLQQLGFRGNERDILQAAWAEVPEIVLAAASSAGMWVANSATVTPSCDSADKRLQITPANLSSKFHRSIEAPMTARLLKQIFCSPHYFNHHAPLPSGSYFSDEGAANHTCLNDAHGKPGVHLFVYGRHSFLADSTLPAKFPPRQTCEASQAIARLHQLNPEAVLFFQQSPEAIDAGVFHNDVIAVGNNNIFLYHEKAYLDSESVIAALQKTFDKVCGAKLLCIKVTENQVPLKEAASSYLFNSQLVTLPDGCMALIAPADCRQFPKVMAFLDELINHKPSPIRQLHFLNLRESMRNGGGPACLRLRVTLTRQELDAVNPRFLFTEELYHSLKACVRQHYPSKIMPGDLGDFDLFKQSKKALQAVYQIFDIPYPL